MDPAAHLDHLRTDGEALLAAYLADPAAPVVSCPGWDRAALLAHVGGVHAWARTQVGRGTAERVRFSDIPRPPEGDALPGWYEAGLASLLAGLAGMDTAATWPTWAGPQPGTFFPRRMAQETAVHRRDADPQPLDPALAVDGVDEMLTIFLPRLPVERFGGRSGTLHLHATDAEGEWLVEWTADGVRVEQGHAKGDCALRGAAGDLLLWTWNRAPLDGRFEVFGDATLLDLWRTTVVF